MDHCQAACDDDPECKAFEVTNCSTESDAACMGRCTRFRPKEGEGEGEGLETGTRKVARNVRVYAKRARTEETDPHVKGFFRRNNQCSMDGKPVYRYSFLGSPGSDRTEGFANPRHGSDNGLHRIPRQLRDLQRKQASGIDIHVKRNELGGSRSDVDAVASTHIGIIAYINPDAHEVTVGGETRKVADVSSDSVKYLRFVRDRRQYEMEYIRAPVAEAEEEEAAGEEE